MGYVIIHGQFHNLGVDHEKTHLFRSRFKEDAAYEAVDTYALTSARSPCNQKVRHLRQIGRIGFAINGFAQRHRQRRFGAAKFFSLQYFAQIHRFAILVGYFYADHGFAGYWSLNANPLRAHNARQIIRQRDDSVDLYACSWLDFIARDNRARAHFYDLSRHIKVIKCFF